MSTKTRSPSIRYQVATDTGCPSGRTDVTTAGLGRSSSARTSGGKVESLMRRRLPSPAASYAASGAERPPHADSGDAVGLPAVPGLEPVDPLLGDVAEEAGAVLGSHVQRDLQRAHHDALVALLEEGVLELRDARADRDHHGLADPDQVAREPARRSDAGHR